jgi:hypothetical protein
MKRTLSATLVIAALAGTAGLYPAAAEGADAWGTVKGTVVYGGEAAPAPRVLEINKDQEHCLGKGPIVSDEWVVDPATKGVRWTFVWLAPLDPKQKLAVHPDLVQVKQKEVVLDQPTCRFVPHALAVRQGQTLLARNSAPVAHNVHWTGIKNPGGNLIVPSKGEHAIKNLVADRYPIKINCDIHGWMNAYVRVFDHPYYALTGKDGSFTIKDAPAGKYRLMVWHETGYGPGGSKGTEVTIKGGESTDVGALSLKPSS